MNQSNLAAMPFADLYASIGWAKTEVQLTPKDVDLITSWVMAHANKFPDFNESWTLGANAISLRVQATDIYLELCKGERK